jgi:hypothetical protein
VTDSIDGSITRLLKKSSLLRKELTTDCKAK